MAERVEQEQPRIVTEQPKALHGMPTMKEARAKTGSEEWSSNIFDCFKSENGLCIKTCFCPCVTYGKTMHRRREPSMASYKRVNNDCLRWAGSNCCHLSWLLNFLQRSELRENYNLKGDHLTDCLYSYFCHCCVLIQHEKEVLAKHREAGVISEGYVAPVGMSTVPEIHR